jgi:hypothetical protein
VGFGINSLRRCGEQKERHEGSQQDGLLVQPQCVVHLEGAETTMGAWNALQSAYEGKGVNRRCILLGKLFNVKNFNNMENYVTQVLTTAQEIASIGKALDDYLIATLLLRGLTPEYKPMSLALENSGVELTTDYIKMKLLQEGYNLNQKASYSSENVLASHYKCRKSTEYNSEQKPKYVRNQYRTNQGCFICNKRGHRTAKCYNPYRENFKRKGI